MAELELVQAGFIKPIVDDLKRSGVNMDPLIRTAGLHKFHLDREDTYVPSQSVYSLFDAISRDQGITDFFGSFFELCRLVSMSQWGQLIAHAPNVLHACKMAVQYDRVVATHEPIQLEIMGAKSMLWQRFEDEPVSGWGQANDVSLALMMNGFKLAGGRDWQPLEIHFQGQSNPNLDGIIPPQSNTKLYFGQPVSAVVFPTAMFSMPMLGREAYDELSLDIKSTSGLSSKIRHLLESNARSILPSIQDVSEMADMSIRSLQRKLAAEGTSFQDLVDNWRFNVAIQLLSDGNTTIREISQALGYANAPNFDRAFRRWTNSTPLGYREQISA